VKQTGQHVTKSPEEERAIIVGKPATRRYGAEISIHLQTSASIGGIEGVCIPLSTGAVLTLSRVGKAPWEGGDKFICRLEGFSTAVAAEDEGRRMAAALLWTAIKSDFPVRLEYAGSEPAVVFDRTRGSGLSAGGFATVGRSAETFLQELHQTHRSMPLPDPRLLLSMEILAGARVEASDRARFLASVSALEPLARQQHLGDAVSDYVAGCLVRLREVGLADQLENSLAGRIRQLRDESVRQATQRVVKEALPDDDTAWKSIDALYALRSQVIHDGRPRDSDTDLQAETRRVSDILRRLYARLLND